MRGTVTAQVQELSLNQDTIGQEAVDFSELQGILRFADFPPLRLSLDYARIENGHRWHSHLYRCKFQREDSNFHLALSTTPCYFVVLDTETNTLVASCAFCPPYAQLTASSQSVLELDMYDGFGMPAGKARLQLHLETQEPPTDSVPLRHNTAQRHVKRLPTWLEAHDPAPGAPQSAETAKLDGIVADVFPTGRADRSHEAVHVPRNGAAQGSHAIPTLSRQRDIGDDHGGYVEDDEDLADTDVTDPSAFVSVLATRLRKLLPDIEQDWIRAQSACKTLPSGHEQPARRARSQQRQIQRRPKPVSSRRAIPPALRRKEPVQQRQQRATTVRSLAPPRTMPKQTRTALLRRETALADVKNFSRDTFGPPHINVAKQPPEHYVATMSNLQRQSPRPGASSPSRTSPRQAAMPKSQHGVRRIRQEVLEDHAGSALSMQKDRRRPSPRRKATQNAPSAGRLDGNESAAAYLSQTAMSKHRSSPEAGGIEHSTFKPVRSKHISAAAGASDDNSAFHEQELQPRPYDSLEDVPRVDLSEARPRRSVQTRPNDRHEADDASDIIPRSRRDLPPHTAVSDHWSAPNLLEGGLLVSSGSSSSRVRAPSQSPRQVFRESSTGTPVPEQDSHRISANPASSSADPVQQTANQSSAEDSLRARQWEDFVRASSARYSEESFESDHTLSDARSVSGQAGRPHSPLEDIATAKGSESANGDDRASSAASPGVEVEGHFSASPDRHRQHQTAEPDTPASEQAANKDPLSMSVLARIQAARQSLRL